MQKETGRIKEYISILREEGAKGGLADKGSSVATNSEWVTVAFSKYGKDGAIVLRYVLTSYLEIQAAYDLRELALSKLREV